MQLSQVRFGEVIRHTEKDQYARVLGLKKVNDEIHIEVSGNQWWHPANCVSQTDTEKGEIGDAYYFAPQELSLDREV